MTWTASMRTRWRRLQSDARGLVDMAMGQRFLRVGAFVGFAGALSSVFEDFAISDGARGALVGGQLALGLACLAAARLVGRVPPHRLVLLASWACIGVATLVAIAIGHGAHSLTLAFYPLVICIVAVLVGARPALAMTLGCAAIVGALALAEQLGWIAGAAALGASPLSHPLTSHALLLMAGFTVGAIMLYTSNASYLEAHERETRFRGLLSIAAEHYWETDAALRLTRWDDCGTMQPGPMLADRLGQPLTDLLAALAVDAPAAAAAGQALAAQAPLARLRLALPAGAGIQALEVSGQPRRDAEGRFAGYWGVAHDVSAETRHHAESRRATAMLQTTFEASPDLLALTDAASGRFLMVNQAFEDTLGYSRAEAVGRTSAELGTWESDDDRARFVEALQRDGRLAAWRAYFRDRGGRRITMQVAARAIQLDGVEAILIAARDVTAAERQRVEYAAVLEGASVGIAFTRAGRIVGANPFFERLFGWAPGTMLGQGPEAIGATQAQCDAMKSHFAREGGTSHVIETSLARRDGSRFWCRLQADPLGRAGDPDEGMLWIAQDVTDRRREQRELAAARDAAEAASRAKSEFLANTSHEIRTPLNGLLGLARLARDDGLPESQRRRYLGLIVESAQSLAAILTDILDLSKIEAGKLEVETAPFDLDETLRAIVGASRPVAQERGLALTLTIAGTLPDHVLGDAMRVRQIVANFVSNAIKFTDRGHVHVEAFVPAPGRVRIEVQDTGIGIDDETRQRLFQPFSQGDTSTTRRHGGTGLGLSISRELAQLLGGDVGVRSQPGEGSVFWVELPLPACAPADAQAEADPAAIDDDDVALAGRRMLVAEDNPINMMITTALLERWGVAVDQATDGAAACAAVLAAARGGRSYDAVLMDVQMPVQSGYEATRALRDALGAALPPVIALTATATVADREQAFASGMCDYLTKPIDPTRLRQQLVRRVGRAPSRPDRDPS